MNKTLLSFIFATFSSLLFGQFPVPVDTLYSFMKSNSILRNTIDWKPVDETFQRQIKNAQTLNDTMKCFVKVLESLNDVHSQIYLNNQFYGNFPAFSDTTLAWIKPLNDKAISLTNQIKAAWFENEIAYIMVPSIQVYDQAGIEKYAQSIYDSLNMLSAKKPKGFIIDLRLNGGGNLYPMLSGLSLLLGNNIIGYETDVFNTSERTWEIRNFNFTIGGYQATNISNEIQQSLDSILVAVLIGPVTKSSGSMTAIAFKGRSRTVFIGEPTADGYTTSNGYFQFAPNLMLNFATNFVADRNIIIYKSTVNPDVNVYHGDNFENLTDDKKIKSAFKWFLENNKP